MNAAKNSGQPSPPLSLAGSKIKPSHWERLAIVYVRQSTPRQVAVNRESTDLQYQLVRRAEGLGWRPDRVLVIDDDLGQSASTAVHRVGFQRLLAEVGLNHVGLILGSEMSRLARSCKDWYQLLELAAVFGVLIADQEGLYDPGEYNDRLLLGLKGTMSEAELHVLRDRLLRGKRNKAARGELLSHAPVGYIRLPTGEMVLDPDQQVQAVVRLVFEKFAELGSARQVLLYLTRHGIRLPIRPRSGPARGQLEWRLPVPATIYNMLRHPMYAGAYCYGRSQTDPRHKVAGKPQSGRVRVPEDQWQVLRRNQLPAYISWEEYETNRERLRQNCASFATAGTARRGPALLAGLVACAHCGWRLFVHYRGHLPRYICRRDDPVVASPQRCPTVAARVVDDLVSQSVLTALQPAAVELSLAAADNFQREAERLESHWQQQLERARYHAERARRQYDAAEPENRLVARELERRWDDALREEQRLTEDYARFRQSQATPLSDADRRCITGLAADIPALWATAGPAERKAIIRHLVERVEVGASKNSEQVAVTIRWTGGHVSCHAISRPVGKYERLRDFPRLLARIRELRSEGRRSAEIAACLNAEDFRSPKGDQRFTADRVRQFVARFQLNERRLAGDAEAARLDEGEVWMTDLAVELGIPVATLTAWCRKGWVHARKVEAVESRWAVWVDGEEKDRLRRLGAGRGGGVKYPYPAELKEPKVRPPGGRKRCRKRR